MKLLSIGNDSKTSKGEKFGVLTGICYLAPAEISGKNLCKFSTPECRLACLYSAGRGEMPNVQKARIARAQMWNETPNAFLDLLRQEICGLIKKAKRKGFTPAVRLNGTSDILWENHGIISDFPDVQFYDYTKYPSALRQNLPVNYHLTYSYTGAPISKTFSDQWRKRDVNTAIVFRPSLPAEWFGLPVINGDESDLRFADQKNVIVGLKAKGKARKGISSFVVDVSEELNHAQHTVAVLRNAALESADPVPASIPGIKYLDASNDRLARQECNPYDLMESGKSANIGEIELRGEKLARYVAKRFGGPALAKLIRTGKI